MPKKSTKKAPAAKKPYDRPQQDGPANSNTTKEAAAEQLTLPKVGLPEGYDLKLWMGKEGEDCAIYDCRIMYNGKKIGIIEANVARRPGPGFYDSCDAATQEMYDAAQKYFTPFGFGKKWIWHDVGGLPREGPYVHIQKVEISDKEHRHKDIGILAVNMFLRRLGTQWAIATAVPGTELRLSQEHRDIVRGKMQAYFRRIGFKPVPNDSDSFYYYLFRRDWETATLLPRSQPAPGEEAAPSEDFPQTYRDVFRGLMMMERGEGEGAGNYKFFEALRKAKSPRDFEALKSLKEDLKIDLSKVDFLHSIACSDDYINHINEHGVAPLHCAATIRDLRLARKNIAVLLEAGARTDVKDEKGRLPMDFLLDTVESSFAVGAMDLFAEMMMRRPDEEKAMTGNAEIVEVSRLLMPKDVQGAHIDGIISPRVRWAMDACVERLLNDPNSQGLILTYFMPASQHMAKGRDYRSEINEVLSKIRECLAAGRTPNPKNLGLKYKSNNLVRSHGDVFCILDCVLNNMLEGMDWAKWNALPESPFDKRDLLLRRTLMPRYMEEGPYSLLRDDGWDTRDTWRDPGFPKDEGEDSDMDDF